MFKPWMRATFARCINTSCRWANRESPLPNSFLRIRNQRRPIYNLRRRKCQKVEQEAVNGDNGYEHDNEDDVISNCDCIMCCDFECRGHGGERDDEDFGSVGSDPYRQYPRP